MWALYGLLTVAVVVTYARLPVAELYHVSNEGIEGGFSRALVLANYPLSLGGIALALVAADRLPGRAARALAALAVVLCAVTAWPGVVSQADLDAKPVNALPALGLLLALGLGVAAVMRGGVAPPRVGKGDVVLLALLAVASLPWLAADLGFYLLSTAPDTSGLRGVHLGHHHGIDGALLATTALLLARTLPGSASRRLRAGLAGLLALMLAYGLTNFAEDLWHEQVVKRGWADWKIPSALVPGARPVWACILAAAALLWLVWLRRAARGGPRPA